MVMKFEYRARDIQGQLHTGVVEAINSDAVVEALWVKKYYIIGLREIGTNVLNVNLKITRNPWLRVGNSDLVLFTRQLNLMLTTGLPIVRCLVILREQTNNERLKQTLTHIHTDLEAGCSMHDSFAKHPRVFSGVYTSMLRAGEMGGVLEGVLDNLSQYLEDEDEFISGIRNAAIYPLCVLIVAVITVIILAVQFMPRLAGVLISAGAELPQSTQFILSATQYFQDQGLALGLFIAGLVYVGKKVGRTNKGRYWYDRAFLSLPIVGRIAKQISVARFASALGLLMESGIPIVQAFEIAEGTAGNSVIAEALAQACRGIREGDNLHRPLQKTGIFEPMLIQMLAFGEATGNLDRTLLYIARHYKQVLKNTREKLTAMMEPALIFTVAVTVGLFVISILQPLLDLMNLEGI